jgi:hypothetical protein
MHNSNILLADFTEGDFKTTIGFPHPTQRTIMPVVALSGTCLRPLGTCFAVSNNGLLLTARHVIEEALAPSRLPDGGVVDCWSVGVIYVAESESNGSVEDLIGGFLPVSLIYTHESLDIAVMLVPLPVDTRVNEPLRMPCLQLSPGLPKVGSLSFAVVYHAMEWECTERTHQIFQSYSASRGAVQAIHFPVRDRAVLPFPCFEVAARYDQGMSGAPVLNLAVV